MKPVVLIVDDEPAVRKLFKRLFEVAGYSVLQAGSVAEGVAACLNATIDLAVVDFVLPDGDGLQFIRYLAALPGKPASVLTTGHYAPTVLDLTRHYGGTAVIEKGSDPAELVRFAESFYARHQAKQAQRSFGAA
jgi:two-component system, NtrC family, response regulator PilR